MVNFVLPTMDLLFPPRKNLFGLLACKPHLLTGVYDRVENSTHVLQPLADENKWSTDASPTDFKTELTSHSHI